MSMTAEEFLDQMGRELLGECLRDFPDRAPVKRPEILDLWVKRYGWRLADVKGVFAELLARHVIWRGKDGFYLTSIGKHILAGPGGGK